MKHPQWYYEAIAAAAYYAADGKHDLAENYEAIVRSYEYRENEDSK